MAFSYPEATNRQGDVSLSPPHNKVLPVKGNNNNKRDSRERRNTLKSTTSVSANKGKLDDNPKMNQSPPMSPVECEQMPSKELTGSGTINDTDGMGDNTEDSSSSSSDRWPVGPSNHFYDDTKETLMQVLAELKEIKSTTCKIPSIEEATTTFSKDLQSVINRTSMLEAALEASSTRVKELDEEGSCSQARTIHIFPPTSTGRNLESN